MNPKIAVVGAGSIGLYYGGLLAASGCDVHFLLRSDYDEVRKHGIRIVSRETPVEVPVVQSYRDTASIGPCDLVIIALKTTSNGVLTNLVPPLLGPQTTLLTLQNGLGNEALLARLFPGQDIRELINQFAARRNQTLEVLLDYVLNTPPDGLCSSECVRQCLDLIRRNRKAFLGQHDRRRNQKKTRCCQIASGHGRRRDRIFIEVCGVDKFGS